MGANLTAWQTFLNLRNLWKGPREDIYQFLMEELVSLKDRLSRLEDDAKCLARQNTKTRAIVDALSAEQQTIERALIKLKGKHGPTRPRKVRSR